MQKVSIEVKKITTYPDLMEQYEIPQENACNMHVGDKFVSVNAKKPEGICASAWETLAPFVLSLANGKGHFFGDWMKNPMSAMVSCNDGFRPVTFLVEVIK